MPVTCAISIAHDREGGDPGAVRGPLIEAELSATLSTMVGQLVSDALVFDGSLKDAIKRIRAEAPRCALELHFDTGTGAQSKVFLPRRVWSLDGVGRLHGAPRASPAFTLAQRLRDGLAASVPWGVIICPAFPPWTARGRLGFLEDLVARVPAVVLVEVANLDASGQTPWLTDRVKLARIAAGIAHGVNGFLGVSA